MVDVGLGLRLLTPRSLGPDAGRGAKDYKGKGALALYAPNPLRGGAAKGARGRRFCPAFAAPTRVRGGDPRTREFRAGSKPRQEYRAGRESVKA